MRQATVQERDGRIELSGPLRFDTVPAAREVGIRLIRDGARDIDLSDVDDVDSSALALLLEWRRAAARQGRDLHFHAVPTALQELAALSEAERVLGLES